MMARLEVLTTAQELLLCFVTKPKLGDSQNARNYRTLAHDNSYPAVR